MHIPRKVIAIHHPFRLPKFKLMSKIPFQRIYLQTNDNLIKTITFAIFDKRRTCSVA